MAFQRTTVVNLQTEPCDFYGGRGSFLGNPWTHLKGRTLADFVVETREEAIRRYVSYFWTRIERDSQFREQVNALRGKKLGCFCKQKKVQVNCHLDVVAEYLNSLPYDDGIEAFFES